MARSAGARISSWIPPRASTPRGPRCAQSSNRSLQCRNGENDSRIAVREIALREIVLDTETTGLDPYQGHRLIEIGCIELLNRIPTGQVFHPYVNPEPDIPE